jgi:glycerol-3-phosphate O-acyltransferase
MASLHCALRRQRLYSFRWHGLSAAAAGHGGKLAPRPTLPPTPDVPEKSALVRTLRPLLQFVLRKLVRFGTLPESAARLHLEGDRPVCYALPLRQLSALLILEQAAQRLGLPDPLAPLPGGGERSSFLFLTRSGQPSPLHPNPYEYSSRFKRLVAAARADPAWRLQIVPVSVFWGRAPQKQESVLRALLAETWVVPGAFRQFLRLAIHGRDTLLKFGEPIDLQAVIAQGAAEALDEGTLVRRVARLLRAQFRRERERAIGPNLSHRQTLINEVVRSAAVQQVVDERVRHDNADPGRVELAARRIAYGIASDYSHAVIRAMDLALTRLWNRIYDGVEVSRFDDASAAGGGAELVYVPCHRSHIDYLLLSYVIYRRGLTPPHIAAGDNLRLPLVGSILRRGGAFFLRRGFKDDPLYAAVFAEYLHAILSRGFPIEYFVEGGRSRSGRMLAPRAGLLAMTVDSVVRGVRLPVVFVPVYIGYEQLIEGDSYLAELSGKPKEKESLRGILKALRKLRRRFGKVHVNIGEPIHLERHLDAVWPGWREPGAATDADLAAVRQGAVASLATAIVTRIADAVVVNPVNLIAVAMLGSDRHAMDAAQLAACIDGLKGLLRDVPYSGRQELTPLDGAAVVAYGEDLGLLERIAHPLGDIVVLRESHAVLLGYFRNNVLHAFALPALLACLVARLGRIEPRRLEEIVRRLYPFLRAQLFLSCPEDDLAPRMQQYLDAFRALHLVQERGLWIAAPAADPQESPLLHALARTVRQPLEAYFIVAATLVRFGPGALSPPMLEGCSSLLAQRLSTLRQAAAPERAQRHSMGAVIRTLTDLGVVSEVDGRLHFSPVLERSAEDAGSLLPPDVCSAIGQLAQLSPADIARALDASGPA